MTSPIMKHFQYEHLPARLQVVSKQFSILAWAMETGLPEGPEKSVALRKVLEGKDAAVRAALEEGFAKGGRVEVERVVAAGEVTTVNFHSTSAGARDAFEASKQHAGMGVDPVPYPCGPPPTLDAIWQGIAPRHEEAVAELAKDMQMPPHSAEGFDVDPRGEKRSPLR